MTVDPKVPVPECRTLSAERQRDKIIEIASVLEIELLAVDSTGISFERMSEAEWPVVEHLIGLVSRRFPAV